MCNITPPPPQLNVIQKGKRMLQNILIIPQIYILIKLLSKI
jgi:hypothetical protein